MSVECINLPGRLVPHQVPGLHHDGVLLAPVVLDVERPVLLHVLAHVDDGRDDVCADLDVYSAFSLVELLHYCALIGRVLQSVEIFSCTERFYYRRP